MKRLSNKRSIAVFSLFLILAASFYYYFIPHVDAGTFSPRKVTISDSRAGQTANTYDFAFTASISTAIKQVDIKFCNEAGAFTDTCTAPSGFVVTATSRVSDNITGTTRTDSAPAANQFRTVVTTPATQSPLAITISLNTITNPTTPNTTYFARIITYSDTGTTTIDSGTTAFAILTSTSMAVTATVLENFTFSIAAATSGNVNGQAITVTSGTSASTIPLGTLAVGSSSVAAHDVTVSTNAGSGYQVTVKSLAVPPLVSGANDIDSFTGTYGTPTTWSAPAGTTANTNTGFFGYTTEDTDFSAFQSNKYAGFETTPRAIVSNATGVSSQTTRIGWQAQVNAVQPAGAYTGTVILVATPTY